VPRRVCSPVEEPDPEHETLTVKIPRLRTVAEMIAVTPLVELDEEIRAVRRLVVGRILPHLRAEDERHAHIAFRGHASLPGRADLAEVERLAERLEQLWPPGSTEDAEAPHALRSVLFDLETLLRPHFSGGC
jgi:hypothetical protein